MNVHRPARFILGAGLALSPLALAQPATPPPVPAPPPGTTVVEFSQEPFRLDAVGLTMLLPVNTTAQSTVIGSKSTVQVQPKDGSWLVNIQTPRTSNTETTAAKAVDEIVTQVLKEAGESWTKGTDPNGPKTVLVGYKGEVVTPRATVIVHDRPAERVYLRIPASTGGGNVIRGFTVFKTSPSQFVTFELITPESGLAKAQAMYENMVATAEFEDPTRIGADRTSAITAGVKAFERVSEADMRSIVEQQPERWERLFRPASTGADADATELGYRRVRLSVGTRAALDPASGGSGPGSRDPGLVAQLDARFLDKAHLEGGRLTSGRIIDSRSVYFESFDRTQEAWTVQNAVRAGTPKGKSEPNVFVETGGRTGKSVFVTINAPKSPGRSVRPVFQSDGYIGRFDSLILPQVLIRSGIVADFGFYVYQSDSESIKLRRDSLEQPADLPGAYRLTTRLAEDKPPQVSVYNEKGQLIRTEMPDGSRWEPITIDKLISLWKSKGLPMD